MCVSNSVNYFYKHIAEQLEMYGLTHDMQGRPIWVQELVDIIEGYKGLGYGKTTEEELGEWTHCVHNLILIQKTSPSPLEITWVCIYMGSNAQLLYSVF